MVFNEQIILEKLNKLNTSKSPGPDGIHPRVLFELRYEVLEPLNILFESSYKLGKLPDEWKLGHVTSLVRPHLEYAFPVWANIKDKDIDKLENCLLYTSPSPRD